MPIKSYLAYPEAGRTKELKRSLQRLPGCEVHSAENRELLILLTDTADQESEERLLYSLGEIAGLQCLTLVAGIPDPPEVGKRETHESP